MKKTAPFLFIPSNETHVKMMYPVAKIVPNYVFWIIEKRGENADVYLKELGETFENYDLRKLKRRNFSAIIIGNDWGAKESAIILMAKSKGIPTVCIQEGPLDFEEKRTRRLCSADYIFAQGNITSKLLKRKRILVTGNPKYDDIKMEKYPKKTTVMINSNFTYGIFEDWRDRWVKDVIGACEELGLDYFISQHPRDRGKFPEYPVKSSNAFKVNEHLRQSTIVVSRFSSIAYEALFMGRAVVYYNPHGEKMKLFNEDNTGGIIKAYEAEDLKNALLKALNCIQDNLPNRKEFLKLHCGFLDGKASERCAEALFMIRDKKPRIFLQFSIALLQNIRWHLKRIYLILRTAIWVTLSQNTRSILKWILRKCQKSV